ncbi:GNAT family N-acetyltransferase [Sorangium sp. So ce1151]|uniref:GNAT family N-acetyltransferase n=1 Tax=Sorangium sp. So ce1151 TaxID=3133332 RepID=UPI003F5EA2E6
MSMRWPDADTVAREVALPSGVRARQLARADIPTLVQLLAEWHPGFAVAEDASLLEERFYTENVALAGEGHTTTQRPVHVTLLESEAAPVACLVCETEADGAVNVGRFSLVAPRFRRRGLGRALIELHVALSRAVGASVIYALVELDNLVQQAAVEGAGESLGGILPDSDRKQVGSEGLRCVPEAVYIKTLVPAEELVWPEPAAMQPATAALMKLLFDHGDPPGPLASFRQRPVPDLGPAARALLEARRGEDREWPEFHLLAGQLALPPGVVVRRLASADLPVLMDRLPAWHPDTAHGPQRRLLSPAFYAARVALAGEDMRVERRPAHAWVVERDGALAGLSFVSCDLARSTLFPELIVIDPRRRAAGLARVLLHTDILAARAIGVETITAFTPLRDPHGQRLCEGAGFRLVGILPAAKRQVVSPGVVKYGFEAVYSISLVPPEQRYIPPREAMPPRLAALADFVFGPREELPA